MEFKNEDMTETNKEMEYALTKLDDVVDELHETLSREEVEFLFGKNVYNEKPDKLRIKDGFIFHETTIKKVAKKYVASLVVDRLCKSDTSSKLVADLSSFVSEKIAKNRSTYKDPTELKKKHIHHPVADKIMFTRSIERVKKVLLYGPPGTGKTSIAHNMFIYSNYTSCLEIQELDDGRLLSPSLATLIDDVDLLVEKRNDGNSENLKKLLDFLDKPVNIVLTTNNPEKLDPAVFRYGRIDDIIYIGTLDVGELPMSILSWFVRKNFDSKDKCITNVSKIVSEKISTTILKHTELKRYTGAFLNKMMKTIDDRLYCKIFSIEDEEGDSTIERMTTMDDMNKCRVSVFNNLIWDIRDLVDSIKISACDKKDNQSFRNKVENISYGLRYG
jgi:hypothetical protein